MERFKYKLSKDEEETELELLSSDVSDDEGEDDHQMSQERKKHVETDDFLATFSDDEEKEEQNLKKIFATKPLKGKSETEEEAKTKSETRPHKKYLGARPKEASTSNLKSKEEKREESHPETNLKCGCLPNDEEGVKWFLNANQEDLKKIAATDRFAVNQNPKSLYYHFQNLIGNFFPFTIITPCIKYA